MTNTLEDLRDQVGRLEDLIRLYIEQEQEQVKQHTEFSLDKLESIKDGQQKFLGGLAALIAILFGITQLPMLQEHGEFNDSIIFYCVITIIGTALAACFIYGAYLRWHRNSAWTLGELFNSHDLAISNLQAILEFSIVRTMNHFSGEIEVISQIQDALLVLKRANTLYQIEPHEKIAKLWILPKMRVDYHKERAEYLKSVATEIYQTFIKLKRDKIPPEMRRVFCNVFYDNEQYIKP